MYNNVFTSAGQVPANIIQTRTTHESETIIEETEAVEELLGELLGEL